ncbi:hypothetical protein SOVF_165980 [Spinacia oleracea]|nr:hypothetical protein SOVF_165980 [Spinacia oleracea]
MWLNKNLIKARQTLEKARTEYNIQLNDLINNGLSGAFSLVTARRCCHGMALWRAVMEEGMDTIAVLQKGSTHGGEEVEVEPMVEVEAEPNRMAEMFH